MLVRTTSADWLSLDVLLMTCFVDSWFASILSTEDASGSKDGLTMDYD